MSRCICCDKKLTDSELRAKITLPDGTKEFRDTCSTCNNYVRNPNYVPENIAAEFGIDSHSSNEGGWDE